MLTNSKPEGRASAPLFLPSQPDTAVEAQAVRDTPAVYVCQGPSDKYFLEAQSVQADAAIEILQTLKSVEKGSFSFPQESLDKLKEAAEARKAEISQTRRELESVQKADNEAKEWHRAVLAAEEEKKRLAARTTKEKLADEKRKFDSLNQKFLNCCSEMEVWAEHQTTAKEWLSACEAKLNGLQTAHARLQSECQAATASIQQLQALEQEESKAKAKAMEVDESEQADDEGGSSGSSSSNGRSKSRSRRPPRQGPKRANPKAEAEAEAFKQLRDGLMALAPAVQKEGLETLSASTQASLVAILRGCMQGLQLDASGSPLDPSASVSSSSAAGAGVGLTSEAVPEPVAKKTKENEVTEVPQADVSLHPSEVAASAEAMASAPELARQMSFTAQFDSTEAAPATVHADSDADLPATRETQYRAPFNSPLVGRGERHPFDDDSALLDHGLRPAGPAGHKGKRKGGKKGGKDKRDDSHSRSERDDR